MLFKHTNPLYNVRFRVEGRPYRFVNGKFETNDSKVIAFVENMIGVVAADKPKPVKKEVEVKADEVNTDTPKPKKKKAKKK